MSVLIPIPDFRPKTSNVEVHVFLGGDKQSEKCDVPNLFVSVNYGCEKKHWIKCSPVPVTNPYVIGSDCQFSCNCENDCETILVKQVVLPWKSNSKIDICDIQIQGKCSCIKHLKTL